MMGVNLNDLKPGMVLAQDIINKHGKILLKKETILTDKHIMGLKAWGITEADVKDIDKCQVEKREMKTVSTKVSALVEAELKDFFPEFGSNPVMHEIYRIVKKIKVQQVMTKDPWGKKENE